MLRLLRRKKAPGEMDDEELARALGKELNRLSRREMKSEIVYGRYGSNPVIQQINQALQALKHGDRKPALEALR